MQVPRHQWPLICMLCDFFLASLTAPFLRSLGRDIMQCRSSCRNLETGRVALELSHVQDDVAPGSLAKCQNRLSRSGLGYGGGPYL